jgi:hypothetical protein
MSLRKALQLKTLFTAEQNMFAEKKQITATKTAAEWIDFFEELVVFDEIVDAAYQKVGNAMIGFGVVGVIFFIIACFFPPLFIIFLVILIIFLVLWSRQKELIKLNIANRMRGFLYPFLKVLAQEMEADGMVAIDADFNTGLYPNYVKNNEKKKVGGRDIESTYYEYEVLRLNAKLADKNEWQLVIHEQARKNKVGKYNPRGKYKTKTKYKVKTAFESSLVVKKQHFALKTNSVNSTVPLEGGKVLYCKDKGDKMVLSNYWQTISTEEYPIPAIPQVLATLAPCYTALKQV